ncbi:MAG: organomercurial lyase [Chloroflexota bacterium]
METSISEFNLQVRYQIYRHFADYGTAPTYQKIADLLNVEHETVRICFHELHEQHMIFLEPNSDSVRMANPFSAIPTDFKVKSGNKRWWANCAWDTLGIAAALNIDVKINARYPGTEETVDLQVKDGIVDGKNHLVYFPLPVGRWYDDLIFT